MPSGPPHLAGKAGTRHTIPVARAADKVHGHFLAGEVGEMAGVSGNTIGQWARWGYIRASQSDGDPHVYSVEDVAEAAIVRALLARGIRHREVRRAIQRLDRAEYGEWPLSEAPLATTTEGRPRIVLRENGDAYALSDRGWQLMAAPPRLEDVRLRLRHRQR
jgi:DNA-binding transcriptional MerR regulator